MRWLAFALSGVALASCAQESAAPAKGALPGIQDRSTLRIELVRTGCYGACPRYAVEIQGDGTATYCGVDFVEEVGERTRLVSDADLSGLIEQFHATDFFALKDEYAATFTDNPTYAVTIRYDDREKSVLDYVGERAGMPASVSELQDSIDRVAGTSEWIGEDALGYANPWPVCGTKYFYPPVVVDPDFGEQ